MWSFIFYIVSLLTHSSHASLSALRSPDAQIKIPFSPNELTTIDVVLVIFLLIFRSISSSWTPKTTPRATNGIDATTRQTSDDGDDRLLLPRLSLSMPLELSDKDGEDYLKTLDMRNEGDFGTSPISIDRITRSPFHLSLFLSAISEPGMLLLLASYNCPIKPLGAVNVRNRFEILDLRTASRIFSQPDGQFSVHASLPAKATRVKRGREIDISVSILHHSSANVKKVKEIFRQVFTMLELQKTHPTSSSSSSASRKSRSREDLSHIHTVRLENVPTSELRIVPNLASYFKFASRDPLRWSRLCKDYNPIHISWITAQIFGFKGIIAHGNHVAARAIEALERAGCLQSYKEGQNDRDSAWMEVDFKRPIVIPTEVGARVVEGGKKEVEVIEVFKAEKVMVQIRLGRW